MFDFDVSINHQEVDGKFCGPIHPQFQIGQVHKEGHHRTFVGLDVFDNALFIVVSPNPSTMLCHSS